MTATPCPYARNARARNGGNLINTRAGFAGSLILIIGAEK